MASAKTICGACGCLTSDHETTGVWTEELLAQYGSPCNRCNADPDMAAREANGFMCRGYVEWPIDNIPPPGSWIAVELGCRCPRAVNDRRRVERMQPVYTLGCAIHDWVCKQLIECTHDGLVVSHERPHESCEHCTIPKIECSVCGKVWADWRTTAEQAGWMQSPSTLKFLTVEIELVKPTSPWRCDTCQSV